VKMKSEKGSSLIETTIGLALLGIISIAFLAGLTTASRALVIADEQATGKSLAESQLEMVRNQDYAVSYQAAPIPEEYASYSARIDTELLGNGNLQKITVTIERNGKEVTRLEGYKANR